VLSRKGGGSFEVGGNFCVSGGYEALGESNKEERKGSKLHVGGEGANLVPLQSILVFVVKGPQVKSIKGGVKGGFTKGLMKEGGSWGRGGGGEGV